MGDDAEKKYLASLDFKIDVGLKNLDTLFDKLQQISQESNKISKNISKKINGSIGNINIGNVSKGAQAQYAQIEKIQAKSAANQIKIEQQKNAQIEIANTRLNNKLVLEDKKMQNRLIEQTEKGATSRIASLAKTYLAYQGFNMLRKAASETVQEMINVESQMVAIERVMEEGSIQVNDYRDKLIQLAYDYGNSFDNVADVTLRLAQAGFDANESLALTEKTLLALNTADLDATQATEDMVAVMAQWGLMTGDVAQETEDYAAIIDKINKVADSYPTTSADIMEALKKTSSAFNIAGASIDETIATIVAAETASQRGGKVIGTALSNIAQQLKAAGKIDIAESLGVNFYTDETKTEFKDLMEIFSELSEKMQQLKEDGKENSVEMQNLLSVFTVFRRNIGASLLGEMAGEDSTYAKVLEDSMNAIGYSVKENEKYMKTAEAAQEQFNATLLELKTSVWDNGLEKVFRSMLLLGGDVADSIKWLTDTFGALPTVIGAATLAFSTFNKKISLNGIKTGIANMNKLKLLLGSYQASVVHGNKTTKQFIDIVGDKMPSSMKKYISTLDGAEATMGGYITKTAAAKVGTLALRVGIAALQATVSIGLSAALQAIVEAFTNWAQATQKAAESISEMNESISEIESSLQDYISNFETLRKEMTDSDITQEEYNKKKKELIKIQNDLIEKYGDEAEGIDLVTGSIESQTEAINNLAKADYKKYIQENEKQLQQLQKTLNTDIGAYFNFQVDPEAYKKIEEFTTEINEELGTTSRIISKDIGVSTLEMFGTPEETLSGFRELYNKIDEYRKNLSGDEKEYWDTVASTISEKIQYLNEQYSSSITEYQQYLQNKLKYDEEYSKSYSKILAASAQLEEAYLKGDEKGIKSAKEALKNAYNEALSQASDDEVMKKYIANQLESAQELADDYAISIKFTTKEGEDTDLKKQIQKIVTSMGDISKNELKEAFDTEEPTEQMQNLKNKLDESNISLDDFFGNAENLGIVFGEISEKVSSTDFDVLNESLQNSISDLANLESQFGTLRDAMTEFNENGYISASTLSNLVNNDLLQYFDFLNGKLVLNEAKMADAATAAKAKAMYDLSAQAAADILAIAEQNAASAIQATEVAANGASDKALALGNAFIALGEDGIKGASGVRELWAAVENTGGVDISGLTDYAKSQIQSVLTNFQASVSTLSNLTVSRVTYGKASTSSSGNSGGSSAAAANAAKREAEEAAEAAEKARKAVVENFEKMIEERERLEDRWVKNKKSLGLISDEDEKYILQQSIQRYKKYAKEVNQLTMATEEEKTELRKKYLEEVEDLEVEYFKLLQDLLDEQIDIIEDRYDEEIDAYEEMIDSKIEKIKEQADAEIEALEKVEDINDRIRQKEEYEASRRELIHGHQGIEYWQQRTGREAQIALAEAQKELEDLDKNWEETVNKWNVEDQIKLIEERRDADIKATEAEREAYLKSLEETKNAEIKALKDKYQYQLDYFNQTGEIIVDNATIQAKEMFEAYKINFIDPVGTELKKALAAQETTAPATTTTPAKTSTTTYTIKYGDTLSAIARSYGTTIEKILAANPYVTNKNLIYAGKTLQIPTSHTGSKIIKDGLVELQAGETVLNMDWAKGLDKMLGQFNNQTNNNNTINNGSTINIDGSLVKVEANIEDKTDAVYLTKRITKELVQKFNLKK